MERLLAVATLTIAFSLAGCEAGPEAEPTVEVPQTKGGVFENESASVVEPLPPVGKAPEFVAETPPRGIESRIVRKDGVFRFVVCRASNLEQLAISRRDMFAESDTSRLLKGKFTKCVSEFKERHQLNGLDVEMLANENAGLFEKLAKTMSTASETSANLGNAYAAYLIAEIGHGDISSAFGPVLQDVSRRYHLAKDDEQELSRRLLSTYSVGWAGNDSEFVFGGWTDPANTSVR